MKWCWWYGRDAILDNIQIESKRIMWRILKSDAQVMLIVGSQGRCDPINVLWRGRMYRRNLCHERTRGWCQSASKPTTSAARMNFRMVLCCVARNLAAPLALGYEAHRVSFLFRFIQHLLLRLVSFRFTAGYVRSRRARSETRWYRHVVLWFLFFNANRRFDNAGTAEEISPRVHDLRQCHFGFRAKWGHVASVDVVELGNFAHFFFPAPWCNNKHASPH